MPTEKRLVFTEFSREGDGGFLAHVRIRCPETDSIRTGEHCNTCPKKVGWTLSTPLGDVGLVCEIEVLTCASCGIALPGAPLYQAVDYCDDCRAMACEPVDDLEIGAQD